ncbi:MAG: HNH endonuclease [Lachnospiraceae bacterium]|nr:HNH endonuclease [Lachnospiraceae bacterium]
MVLSEVLLRNERTPALDRRAHTLDGVALGFKQRYLSGVEFIYALGFHTDDRLGEELPEGNDRFVEAKARVNQAFFREAVLSSYGNRCCITGISEVPLLVASHIKPWKDSDTKTERTNPSNGLCLNALHDKAFDRGLITVLPDLSIRVSSKLTGQDSGTLWLRQCNKTSIEKPRRFMPGKEFLEYHNDVVFIP